MLLELRAEVEEKLLFLEQELALASPLSHNDDQHQTLIKKVRAFRNALSGVNNRLNELSDQ